MHLCSLIRRHHYPTVSCLRKGVGELMEGERVVTQIVMQY